MRNSYYLPYSGSKRNEINLFYDKIDFKNIKNVIEPFCGSCAMSLYISLQQPKKFTYYLNDTNQFLKELYEISIDDEKTKKFEDEFEKICLDLDKDKYKQIGKQEDLMGWFLPNKIHNIHSHIFPPATKPFKKTIKLSDYLIYNFFRTEKIIFTTGDGLEHFNKFSDNKENLILLDPPYIFSDNNDYLNYNKKSLNIYEAIYRKGLKKYKSKIYLILGDNLFIRLLFEKNILLSYDKTYQKTKKKSIHLVISNSK